MTRGTSQRGKEEGSGSVPDPSREGDPKFAKSFRITIAIKKEKKRDRLGLPLHHRKRGL